MNQKHRQTVTILEEDLGRSSAAPQTCWFGKNWSTEREKINLSSPERLHKLLQVMTSRSCLRKMKSLQSCYQSRSLLWRIWNIFCFAILFSCFPHKPKCVVSSILVDSSKLLCEGWHCTPKHQTWRKKKTLQTENALNLFYSPFILMWKKLHFPAFPVLICTSDLLGRCLIRPLLQ